MLDLSLRNWTGKGAEEFANLPPDADLLAEWAEHHEKRNALPHPDEVQDA